MSENPQDNKDVCMVTGCDKPQHCRGQCDGCYKTSRRNIKAGKTTWEQLEANGLAKPDGRLNPASQAIAQLTSGATTGSETSTK